MSVTIWHNPRCTKSRATLALLEERGIKPKIILYLETPPTRAEIRRVLAALKISPREFMRKGEDVFREKGLADLSLSDEELIAAMAENPILIERPVVIAGRKAAIGRPPENSLKIL